MTKLRIVTDGAADMPANWEKQYDIHILPIPVQLAGQSLFLPDPQISVHQFYKMIREYREVPRSSLPSIAHITDFYRSIAQKGDEILSIHVASKMSGTFSVIQNVANELKDEFKISPFDSGAGSAVLGFMCRQARCLSNLGISTEKIVQQLEIAKQNLAIYLTLDNLEFARLSGRVNALQTTLSSLLRIKPIIELKEGILQIAGRVRTRGKAIEAMIDAISEKITGNPMDIAVVHAEDFETALEIKNKISGIFTDFQIYISELALPVASNLGPGTVGIVLYPVDKVID